MKKQNQKWMWIGLVVGVIFLLQYHQPEPESFLETPEIVLPPAYQEKPHFPADNPRWGSGCVNINDCLKFPPDIYDGTFMYDAEGNPVSSSPPMICEGGLCKWR